MAQLNFYHRYSFSDQGWRQRLGYRLIQLWSRPFVHVDVAAGDQVLSADATYMRAMLHERNGWGFPAVAVHLPWPDDLVLSVMQRYDEQRLPYGLQDFVLVPFRRLFKANGLGVICSEMCAEVLQAIVAQAEACEHWQHLLASIAAIGAHAMTPQSLFEALYDHLPVEDCRSGELALPGRHEWCLAHGKLCRTGPG